jgi:hypothetical protein
MFASAKAYTDAISRQASFDSFINPRHATRVSKKKLQALPAERNSIKDHQRMFTSAKACADARSGRSYGSKRKGRMLKTGQRNSYRV